MKIKYFEYIIIYLSVFVVCMVLGIVGRTISLQKGADEYTANMIFWVCLGASIIVYAFIQVFLHEILEKFSPFQSRQSTHHKKQDEVVDESNIKKIRKDRSQKVIQLKQEKLNKAIQYTQNQFASFVSDDDLKLLCGYLKMYAEESDFENIKPIEVKELTNLDLYHFGWNIWNHFKPIKQEEVAKFLKSAFSSLQDITLDSIKKHLRDDEKKGIIQIQQSLVD